MRLYLPILAVFLCVLLDALASLPSGTDYYGRIKDATPVVTNAWQSVQKDVEGLVDAKISGATNALGLAMAKDLERLPTHEAVTNIVRDNIGSVWDAQLGVAWQARMHNGHLYYIAVTNVQEVK